MNQPEFPPCYVNLPISPEEKRQVRVIAAGNATTFREQIGRWIREKLAEPGGQTDKRQPNRPGGR